MGNEQAVFQRPDLLTRKQAAAYLGVSVGWLAQRATAGTGPAITRIGNKVKYLIEDLDQFIAQCKEEGECRSTKEKIQQSGGVGFKSAGKKYGGALARQIANELRLKNAG